MSDSELSRAEILSHAIQIARHFRGIGLTLTLRQLYYQFVGRGLTGSGDKVYKRIGSVLTDARYDGSFPIELLEDRDRTVGESSTTRTFLDIDVARAVEEAESIWNGIPDFLVKGDRWIGQPLHVSVWVEKKALEGVFAGPCDALGVGLFACKGYPSVSSLYDWIRTTDFAINGERRGGTFHDERSYSFGHGFDWTENHTGSDARKAVILYFGDHDPDGWEIPRSAERGIATLMRTYGMEFEVEFVRVGLNMDQIRKYNPPPFEAKITSARHAKYVAEHRTNDAWELDALDPQVLDQLIRSRVSDLFDQNIYIRERERIASLRERVRDQLGDIRG